MTRHSARASPALRALNEADPAMAALALWCDHRDSDAGPAAATQASTIRYAPAFDALPRHEQIGLAAHHILHVALRHTVRMRGMEARLADRFDRLVYTIAADSIVNEALLAAGYALPRPALVLTDVLGTLGLRSSVPDALAEWDVDRLYIRLMQDGPGEGRAAEKAKRLAEEKAFDPDMEPEEAKGAPEQAEETALWRQHLSRAMEAGRLAGRGIGMLGHRLADIPVPSVPWEVVLRGLVSRAVTEAPRPTHRRPSRAWIAMEAFAQQAGGPVPAFQPGTLRASDQPRVVVGLDASSSIDEGRLTMFMGEIAGIARRTMAEVQVIAFDDEPRPPLRLDPARWQAHLAALDLPRGGGTSFAPVIRAAVALRPSILVMLTDMEGEFGPAPRLPVVWAVPDAVQGDAPFGKVISLAR